MIIINKKLYHTVKEASEDLGITRQAIHNAVKVQGTRTLKFYPNNTACRWERRWEPDHNVKLSIEVEKI